MLKSIQVHAPIVFLTILYIVGTAGFLLNIHPDFPRLTPVNLMISLGFSLYFHPNWSLKFLFWCLLTSCVGFGIEVVGVSTGQIFGHYQYGETLGFKYQNTPLSIAVNWLLTAYSSAALVSLATKYETSWWLKSVLAAALMVSLDIFIEPIAHKLGFWSWQNGVIPLQNYIGWFLTALPLQMLFFTLIKSAKNKVAMAVLLLQFAFFLLLNAFLK